MTLKELFDRLNILEAVFKRWYSKARQLVQKAPLYTQEELEQRAELPKKPPPTGAIKKYARAVLRRMQSIQIKPVLSKRLLNLVLAAAFLILVSQVGFRVWLSKVRRDKYSPPKEVLTAFSPDIDRETIQLIKDRMEAPFLFQIESTPSSELREATPSSESPDLDGESSPSAQP